MSREERLQSYSEQMEKARRVIPDINDTRSARIEMIHGQDPGYSDALMRLGVNDHFGLMGANMWLWLGMPEFPYFASPLDLRKTNQGEGGSLVCHQWDFCGGWHFLGPQGCFYTLTDNNWERAKPGVYQGVNEAKNLAEMSGHPAFITPLHDATMSMFPLVEHYLRYVALELPKEFKLVFARSIDIADYYRRHFRVTPRTVFVSKTDQIFYDMQWLNNWAGKHFLLTNKRIPWNTGISSVMELRRTGYGAKDPLSCEYLLVEDQKRSIRFERECPNPIWWFDYTHQEEEVGPEGSRISYVVTPDVQVELLEDKQMAFEWPAGGVDSSDWVRDERGLTIKLRMRTGAEFPNYAIALWGLPEGFARYPDPSRIETNAKEFLLAKNTDGEYHLVLFFDLEPNAELGVTLREP